MGGWNHRPLSRAERRGLAVLAALLLAVAAGRVWLRWEEADRCAVMPGQAERAELHAFRTATRIEAAQEAGKPAELFPFDPNTTDSLTFVRLGLTPRQALNALTYRRKGGRWRSPRHFSRLYGLSAEDFERLRPFIRIVPEGEAAPPRGVPAARDIPRQEKLPEGNMIDLNACDTAQLKAVPGIGSYYAGKICRYRERLGGFLSVEQIKEVEGLPPGVERWFSVGSQPTVRKLRVNRASFKELVRHPYVSEEQAKAIRNYVHHYGRIGSWRDLKFLDEFTEADVRRLAPYVAF